MRQFLSSRVIANEDEGNSQASTALTVRELFL